MLLIEAEYWSNTNAEIQHKGEFCFAKNLDSGIISSPRLFRA